jgi:hypothetical protein
MLPRTRNAVLLLLSITLVVLLFAPLLGRTVPEREATLRVYFEPSSDGVKVWLDHGNDGYVTELEIDDDGDLVVPAGRTVAVPLQTGVAIGVRSLSTSLAPYIVLARGDELGDHIGTTRLEVANVPEPHAGELVPTVWDLSASWSQDRARLRELRARCGEEAAVQAVVRPNERGVALSLGACDGEMQIVAEPSKPRLMLVVAGTEPAIVSLTKGPWPQQSSLRWPLLVVLALGIAALVAAVGAGTTLLVCALLWAFARVWWTEAVLVWFLALPIWLATGATRLLATRLKVRPGVAVIGGGLVLAGELAVALALVATLDIGSFGNERITRNGDDGCALIGYSTVRGDTLRAMDGGIVERLDGDCPRCAGRTSRFSREAQTLRWVRQTVCSRSFPVGADAELTFVGGANDDLFYRPSRFSRLLSRLAGALRAVLEPANVTDWRSIFAAANQVAVTTLDEQLADLDAIADCAERRRIRLRFVHDFLIWDLVGGRSPARQTTFEARRRAAREAGIDFIDLLAEFGDAAGVAWLNDFIHPSAVGHEMIARLLCDRPVPVSGSARVDRADRSAPAALR